MTVNVHEVVGPHAITLNDGHLIHREVQPNLLAGLPVTVDFAGIECVATPFVNAAFGRLLQHIKGDDIVSLLRVVNMSESGRAILVRVLENSDEYYRLIAARKAIDALIEAHSGGTHDGS